MERYEYHGRAELAERMRDNPAIRAALETLMRMIGNEARMLPHFNDRVIHDEDIDESSAMLATEALTIFGRNQVAPRE